MHLVLGKLIVLLLLIVTFIQCRQANELKKGFVDVEDKSKIAYITQGSGDTTLLFIHGWCINKEYWENQFRYFKDHYKVVAIDLPGFGASSKTRLQWSFNQYAKDVHEVIKQLDLKNVILIGHSMSGDIILNVDVQFPDSNIGLIGIDNLHSPNGPKDSTYHAGASIYYDLMEKNFDSTVTKFAMQYLFQPTTQDTIVRRVMHDILATPPPIAVEVLRSLDAFSETEKSMEQKLNHTLCLVNSDVTPIQMDSLNKYCAKGIKAYSLHATGHYPMIEKPDEFNIALQQAIWKQ